MARAWLRATMYLCALYLWYAYTAAFSRTLNTGSSGAAVPYTPQRGGATDLAAPQPQRVGSGDVLHALQSMYLRNGTVGSMQAAATASATSATSAAPTATASAAAAAANAVPATTATATAASCASTREHTDLDGAVVQDGYGPRGLSLPPDECRAACGRTRGCNVWVSCTDAKACGQQCWLKWVEVPSKAPLRGEGAHVPWSAGTCEKDKPGSVPLPSAEQLEAVRVVALRTAKGELRIKLRPDWHAPSVAYVRTVALTDTCTAKCVFYRAEPGFLLQGGMRAVVPPNSRCRAFPGGPADCTDPQERPGGKMMEKGQVAWAGGSAGPDLFILMGRNGFGATHTVWGELADEASLALALELVQAPIEKGLKPGSMRMIADPISFTVHVV